jgi:ribosome biogenesis protein MAK21
LDALREVFIAALLPDRKLRFFEERPLGAVPARGGSKDGARRLLLWHLEDQLKRRRAPCAPGLSCAW